MVLSGAYRWLLFVVVADDLPFLFCHLERINVDLIDWYLRYSTTEVCQLLLG